MPSESRIARIFTPTSHESARIAGAISPGVYVSESPFCARIASAMPSKTASEITPAPVPATAWNGVPAFVPSSASTAAAISEGR